MKGYLLTAVLVLVPMVLRLSVHEKLSEKVLISTGTRDTMLYQLKWSEDHDWHAASISDRCLE